MLAAVLAALVAPEAGPAPAADAGRAADPGAAARILADHCRAREAMTTLRAKFVQTRVFTLLDTEDRSAGVLYYRKPDAVRWQYTDPDSSYTVLHGDSGWAVLPRIRQVQRFGMQGTRAANVLAIVGFGACGADLERSFQISAAPPEDGDPVLVLVPVAPGIAASFDRIELMLDPKSHLPRRVSLHETSGDTVRFEFRDLQPGAPVDARLFDWAVPAGYEVVG